MFVCYFNFFYFFFFFFFFFNDTATTEIYTLSLHDALPICFEVLAHPPAGETTVAGDDRVDDAGVRVPRVRHRAGRQGAAVAEVEDRDPVEDVDEELERWVPGGGGEEDVQRPVVGEDACRLVTHELAEPQEVVLVEPSGSDVGDDLLEGEPRREHLV